MKGKISILEIIQGKNQLVSNFEREILNLKKFFNFFFTVKYTAQGKI